MSTQDGEDNTARILVVEDDLRWRESHLTNLTRWGYLAFVAQGKGQSLLEDAISQAMTYRCHIALVDMRLFDDDHRSDDAGLNLVQKLKPTESIIVSGYGDVHSVNRALLDKGARYFIGKEDGPKFLKKKIDTILQTISASKKEIEIEWAPGLSSQTIVLRLFKEKAGLIPIDQVNDVLALLFPEAKRLRLQTLDSSNLLSSSGPTLHSVVLKVYVDERVQPEIVKITTPEDIEVQGERYKKYVDGHLLGTFYTNLKAQAYLWDIGAARYDFLGAPNQNMITWAELYQTSKSVDKIIKPLHFFFDQLWSHYYNKADRESAHSLLDAYSGVWGVNWRKRLQSFSKDKYINISMLKSEVLNPVKWLLDKIDAEKNQLDERIPLTCLAITHGDFHGENLFVHEGRAWVIDFERTGYGPILQDFIELESNILIQLANVKDVFEFYKFATSLNQVSQKNHLKLISSLNDKEAKKALTVIQELRGLAEKTTKKLEITEYLYALLFNCLFLVSLPGLDHQQHQKALLLGGLICERLELTGILKYRHTFPLESRQTAYSLGCFFYDAKRFAEAREAFEVGHEAIETLRTERLDTRQEERLVQENADFYARLVHCCVLLGDDDAAFEYGVAGKRRKIVDSLAKEGFNLFTAVKKNKKAFQDSNWTAYWKLLQQINQFRDRARRKKLSIQEQKAVCDEVEGLMAKQNTLWEILKRNYPTLIATQQAARFTVQQANQLASDISRQIK